MVTLTEPLVILTGAGVSAESGIPTFRGSDGLWRTHRASDLATPAAFFHDPKLVWEFYSWRREIIAAREPNPAHSTLVAIEQSLSDFTLMTQNVDGLHQRAGSKNILALHGDIWRVRCTHCDLVESDHRVPLPELPPSCPSCGMLLRPDVVWFGEPLPQDILQAAFRAASRARLMLVVGTSALVQPAASLPLLAQRNGATLLEFNLEMTPLSSYADELLCGPAGQVLPEWWQAVQPHE